MPSPCVTAVPLPPARTAEPFSFVPDKQLVSNFSRCGSGPLLSLQLDYGTLGRRITKETDDPADRDATYRYYDDSQAPAGQAGQVIETRNDSDQTTKTGKRSLFPCYCKIYVWSQR